MNLVTIVIPMYNEQRNILGCIESLKNQNNKKFDVIFIDDGSTDSSIKEVEKNLDLQTDFNYKIIKQVNKGAAEARRIGIESSSTDFIMIFDCDDKLSDNMVSEVYEIYNAYPDVDIIIPNALMQNKNGDWNEFPFYNREDHLKPLECLENSLNGWKIHGWFAAKKTVFDKSYKDYKKYNVSNANNINNDEVITRLNFLNSKKIVRSEATYYYCFNTQSTTKKINNKRYLMIKNALIMRSIFKDNKQIEINASSEFLSVVWASYRYLKRHKAEINNAIKWEEEIHNALEHIKYFETLNKLSLKEKIKLTILRTRYLF